MSAANLANEKSNTRVESGRKSLPSQPSNTPSKTSWKDKALALWSRSPEQQSRVWHATWLHFGPLSGLLSIFLTAFSLTASLGILVGSNGQSVNGWSAPPSTYLAIFTAIANMSVRYALTQGVIIAFWRKASVGSTVSRLQSDWRAGTMFRGALEAGRGVGLLGLACLFSTVVVVDGPLLQRASTVIEIANPATVQLNFSVAAQIPHGFSGTWFTSKEAGVPGYRSSYAFNSTLPSPGGPISNHILGGVSNEINTIASPWYNSEPIEGVVQGCHGKCTAKLRAPGLFPGSCTTQKYSIRNHNTYNATAVEGRLYAPPLDTDNLIISATLIAKDRESINLVTGFATVGADSMGEFSLQACTLQSGIGEYDVVIQNDKVITSSLSTPAFVAFSNNTAMNHTWIRTPEGLYGHPSTLGGLVEIFQPLWGSYVSCWWDPSGAGKGWNSLGLGPEAIYRFQAGVRATGGCQSFHDPYEVMLNELNKLAFYIGAVAATKMEPENSEENVDAGLFTTTTGTGYVQGKIDVYHTNYWFFLGATIVEVVCLALIAPTYWGWWHLGRPVSFSPLEMAKAFRSPILADYNSNSTGCDLAAAATDTRIRYGVIMSDWPNEKMELAFGDPAMVSKPSPNTRFDR